MIPRIQIYDICRRFEIEHMPEILIEVDQVRGTNRYRIKMGAMSFINGKFNREVTREVIFGTKDWKQRVEDLLCDMHAELYDE